MRTRLLFSLVFFLGTFKAASLLTMGEAVTILLTQVRTVYGIITAQCELSWLTWGLYSLHSFSGLWGHQGDHEIFIFFHLALSFSLISPPISSNTLHLGVNVDKKGKRCTCSAWGMPMLFLNICLRHEEEPATEMEEGSPESRKDARRMVS